MSRSPTPGDARRLGDMLRGAIPNKDPSELLMPVTDEHALRQFEIEALRQITDNLRRLNEKMDKQGDDIRSIDARLIRIESNSVSASVQKLQEEVDNLQSDKDRRDGAFGLANALRVWIPVFVAMIVVIIVVLKANGKL
jgi:septal ring factor EnvC (AmiA/AmiB activator)